MASKIKGKQQQNINMSNDRDNMTDCMDIKIITEYYDNKF